MTEAQSQHRFRVAFAFGLVYLFWGSTYLGIRFAVERLPPILMAGLRFSIAGSLLLAFCAATGRRVMVGWESIARLAFIGFLLLGVSNAILAWAELYGWRTSQVRFRGGICTWTSAE